MKRYITPTTTQGFYMAELCFNKVDEEPITLADAKKICESLSNAFTNGKYNCVKEAHIINEDGQYYLYITLAVENGSYYEVECEVVPYIPATREDPEEGGYIVCYESTQEMLWDIWKCPDEWDYEIYDEDFDSEEYLWEKVNEYDEPDPDRAYEEWRDSML